MARPKALGDIRGISYIYGIFLKFGLIEAAQNNTKKRRDLKVDYCSLAPFANGTSELQWKFFKIHKKVLHCAHSYGIMNKLSVEYYRQWPKGSRMRTSTDNQSI